MAEPGQLTTLLVVAFVLIAVIVINQLLARRTEEPEDEEPGKELLCKFAHHEGSVVGETVAVDGDRLIMKQAGVYKAVPLAMAEVVDDEVRLRGAVDWDAAIAEGEAWRTKHTQGHDPAVTETLTRSEDVRAPALAAFQRRDEEE